MKKLLGLCLILILGCGQVFAQKSDKGNKDKFRKDADKRMEKIITDLKLNEKQAADFRKANKDFMEKMKTAREESKDDQSKMRAKMKKMRDERNAEMKKIMTEEQYKSYLEKQSRNKGPKSGDRKGGGRMR